MPPVGYGLFIDNVLIFQSAVGIQLQVTSSGLNYGSLAYDNTWAYSGTGTFLGFSTTQGATTPDSDLEIGDTKTINSGDVNLYSVAQQTPAISAKTINSGDVNLYSVAQQTPAISDLTGTEWEYECKQSITTSGFPIDQGSISLTGSVNNDAISYISELSFRTGGLFYNFQLINGVVVFSQDVIGGVRNGVVGDTYIISITGGTDATNPDLIAWFSQNATYQEPTPTPSSNISIGDLSIANMSVGSLNVESVWLGNEKIYGGEPTPSGYEVELSGDYGSGEYVYVQINDDPTWYYAQLGYGSGNGFTVGESNIPNAYQKTSMLSIGIPNVSKIKIGTQGYPDSGSGPSYDIAESTGDFTNLTFTYIPQAMDGPNYSSNEITMTQDSKVHFEGDD